MRLPVQITFRNVDNTNLVEAKILEKAKKLDTFYDDITSCHVTLEQPHYQAQGALYQIKIDITVPGGEIVVNRASNPENGRQDISVTIREAFDAAKRQLQDYARRKRNEIKTHEVKTPTLPVETI